jgi:plastocyanin
MDHRTPYCQFSEVRRKDSPVTKPHRTFIAVASACACSLLGGTALGANQTISVGNDKTLSPNNGSATIDNGDTVTWHWVGPDTNHIIAAFPGQLESWDSDPGVNDIDHVVGFAFPHAFTNVGAFNYRCRIHPDKMFGTITVNGPAGIPTASFTVTPAAGAIVGQTVSFDGTASSDPDGVLVSHEWDLDGNGSFETSGATPSRAYATARTVTVKLRVTDNDAKQHAATRDITISNPAPPPPPPVVPPAPNPFVPPVVLTPPPPAVAKLTFTGPTRQRAADKRGVAVMATCDLACMVTATGSIALPGGKKVVLTKVTKALIAGVQTKLVLMIPKASRLTVLKLFAKGKTLTASVVLKTAGGGTATRRFKLVR